MKNVLLLVHEDEGQEARLQAALDVTRAIDGHLVCLCAMVAPSAVAYDVYSGAMVANLVEQERQNEAANRERLEARLAHEDVSWNWEDALCFPSDAVDEAAGLVDLVVLSSHLPQSQPPEIRRLAGAVARRSGRPVLAVPDKVQPLDLSGTVLIAWDGSREADDALRQAVPLLSLASEIVLLEIDRPEGALDATSAASYLSRHGIATRIQAVQRQPDESICSTILETARAMNAAYIVMGAYGHSPALETLFGGVTRSMLANSEIPLLLAH